MERLRIESTFTRRKDAVRDSGPPIMRQERVIFAKKCVDLVVFEFLKLFPFSKRHETDIC